MLEAFKDPNCLLVSDTNRAVPKLFNCELVKPENAAVLKEPMLDVVNALIPAVPKA